MYVLGFGVFKIVPSCSTFFQLFVGDMLHHGIHWGRRIQFLTKSSCGVVGVVLLMVKRHPAKQVGRSDYTPVN